MAALQAGTDTVTAHMEDCFMQGRCVCGTQTGPIYQNDARWMQLGHNGSDHSIKDSQASIIRAQTEMNAKLLAQNLRLRADVRSWRNTTAVCALFSISSVLVTAANSLGWI